MHIQEAGLLTLSLVSVALFFVYELATNAEFLERMLNSGEHMKFFVHCEQSLAFYILTLAVLVVLGLLVVLAVEKARTQRYLRSTSYNFKIPVDKYDEIKRKQTRLAVHQLKKSELYRKYEEDKRAGRLKDVVLSDGDQIDLSDDQISYQNEATN